MPEELSIQILFYFFHTLEQKYYSENPETFRKKKAKRFK